MNTKTDKEKTKAYDEAIKRAKEILECSPNPDARDVKMVLSFFPELKENEDDRIRKELIKFIDGDYTQRWLSDETKSSWIAWLEKQGTPAKLSEEEQNKFAKGVLSSCALSFIDYLDTHKYEGKMCVSNGECEDIENAFQNAMWDKLHRYYCKYIEKQGKQKPEVEGDPNARKPTLRIIKGKSYLCIKDYRDKNCTFTKGKIYESDKDGFLVDDEEKDTFERKIWEEDAIEYFSLFEQSKTKDVVTDEQQTFADKIEKQGEQKPAIKIELDDNGEPVLTPFEAELFSMMSEAWQGYSFGEEVNLAQIVKEHSIELLERANEQKPAWSEEDEYVRVNLIEYLEGKTRWSKIKERGIDWLKSLKDRIQPQQKQEWSEEDETALGDALWCCKQAASIAKNENDMGNIWYAEKWLKSLKDRYTWKPSNEQMAVLNEVINYAASSELQHWSNFIYTLLKSLREQLKKLKG